MGDGAAAEVPSGRREGPRPRPGRRSADALARWARRIQDQSSLPQDIHQGIFSGIKLQTPQRVRIDTVHLGESPRLQGENPRHTMHLMDAGVPLPPIIVDRDTRFVIDGLHRVRAAIMNGHDDIDAVFYEGSPESAFVLAVAANSSHGLPLSMSDRRAAAAKIVRTHPEWSDRWIASVAGISSRAVASIRRSTDDKAQLNPETRVGRDGRARPVDPGPGRRAAAAYLKAHPDSSLRTVAAFAGISPTTVRDVRNRLSRGDDPVPAGASGVGADGAASHKGPKSDPAPENRPRRMRKVGPLLARLARDPSVRQTETGRDLLRWLEVHIVDSIDTDALSKALPGHSRQQLAELADRCAANWAAAAAELRDS